MAGGSCFMGLSWTQKVSRLIGLSVGSALPNRQSFSLESSTNISFTNCLPSAVLEALSSTASLTELLVSICWASRWASFEISMKLFSASGLQLGSSPSECPLLVSFCVCVSIPTEMHFSLCLTGPRKTSSSSSSSPL